MSLIVHPTAHPRVFFAGGDIFSKDSYSRFDGLLLCVGGFNGFTATAHDLMRDGSIPVPCRIHDSKDGHYAVKDIPALIRHDLDELAARGCKHIGVHSHHDIPRAKAAVRATVSWLDKHPDVIETVTFVDMRDDYYNCFGLDSFVKGYKLPVNCNPSGFEFYFEQVFLKDLDGRLPIAKNGNLYTFCWVDKKPVNVEAAKRVDFSVALFYTALVPQAIARVTEDIQDMFAFSRHAGWPVLDRFSGGWMAPYVYVEDTGLMPEGEQIHEWLDLAEAEYPYFCRVLTHYLLSGIRVQRSADAIRLGKIEADTIKKIHREMRAQLKDMTEYLKGGPMPANYYIPDKIRAKQ